MNYYTKNADLTTTFLQALREDVGSGDITTEALIPQEKCVKALLLAKEPCVICGLSTTALVFKLQDKNIQFKPLFKDGNAVAKGRVIACVQGRARGILTAERVALNLLSHLSGISTQTRRFVQAVKPFKARITDTRKTTPGLRILEKYAVRIGGGYNHRMSLDEMVLVKDNHLKAIGGIARLKKFQLKYKTEIEVKSLREFKQALQLTPDIIMLDNMSAKEMQKAVRIRNRLTPNTKHLAPKLEASGGITLKNVRRVASTGVEMISVGALTHSVICVDMSLEIV